ncbi:MAG TPA: hypothetical protein VFQ53_39395 [Kofleriaceae bacterium]|nr:hypothetical protein [Kofleriaceae bacterium]
MNLPAIVLGAAASIATMRAAIDRGDIDEAARQGALAGPVTIERALASPDRPARLAAIAAAPVSTAPTELLDALARTAADPDRRVALPAARAARTIARDLDIRRRDLPDDLAPDDLVTWRTAWAELARDADRAIELRVIALDVAAALDPAGIGVDFATSLADPDPAIRRAAIELLPMPVPPALRTPLATTVAKDTDPSVALAAAQILCADLAVDPPKPVLDALGPAGLQRIRALIATKPPKPVLRDLGRCTR